MILWVIYSPRAQNLGGFSSHSLPRANARINIPTLCSSCSSAKAEQKTAQAQTIPVFPSLQTPTGLY